jgi:hypothetical protein
MTRIRAYRSTTVALAPLAATVLLALGACSQSQPDADIEQKIAAADARTAAAELRIKLATQSGGSSNGFETTASNPPPPPVGQPVDSTAPVDGTQHAPPRAGRTGPTNEEP